jgi:ribosomal-protein-alanine N-acetyltransferase
MSPRLAVRITRADVLDAEEFLRLEAKCFGMRFSLNTLYYWRPIIDYGWALKAVHRRRIVGGLLAMLTRNEQIYINSIFVDPNFRRRGIGTKLLSKILRLGKGRGFVLDVKAEKAYLHEFYRRHRFLEERVHDNYYLDGTRRVIMLRRRGDAIRGGKEARLGLITSKTQ